MRRDITRIGLINLAILLIVGAAGFVLARQGDSDAGQAGMAFLATGLVIAILSYFQMRLEERERLEKLEFEELSLASAGTGLFKTTEAEIFPAQRAREQFEKLVVPAFAILLFLLQAGGAIGLWIWLRQALPATLKQPMLLMALFGLFALVLLLVGRYCARLAQLEGIRLLRPGAASVLMGSAVCFLVALGIGAVEAGFTRADRYLAYGFAVILGILAVETLINLVLEVYRPRVKGRPEARVIYESRLVGLLGQPAGIFSTLAQALDYQFGFKVSETWFYQFVQRAATWIILGQLAALLLSSCVVFIDSGEEALLERNGRPVAGRDVLGPGVHFKLPWPIDRVYRHRTREVQSFTVGLAEDEESEHPGQHAHETEKTILWTVAHGEEFNLIVASRGRDPGAGGDRDQAPPVNLLTVKIPVQFAVRDLRLWATRHTDAAQLLEKIASQEVGHYLLGVDFFELMSTGRERAAAEMRQRIQSRAEALELGAEILFVGLQGVHPPVKVGKDFNAVVAASQEKEAIIEHARAYALTNVIFARATATNRLGQAAAYRTRVIATTRAQAEQFTNQVMAFEQSPSVFALRSYLTTLASSASRARKIVLTSTNAREIVNLNLEDKLRPDLLDVPVEPSSRR